MGLTRKIPDGLSGVQLHKDNGIDSWIVPVKNHNQFAKSTRINSWCAAPSNREHRVSSKHVANASPGHLLNNGARPARSDSRRPYETDPLREILHCRFRRSGRGIIFKITSLHLITAEIINNVIRSPALWAHRGSSVPQLNKRQL